jgi:hypothetical protein
MNGQETFNSILTINIEGALKSMEVNNLSQFASKIRYIPLETKNDLVISNIAECIYYENHILIANLKECWLFDINGNLIKKIGDQGRGPGEYQYVVNIGADSRSKIYIQSLRDLLEYNPDGVFIKKYNNLFMFHNNFAEYFSKWVIFNDSLLFGHIPNNRGNTINKALLINKSGIIKKQYKNYDIFNMPGNAVRLSTDEEAHIYIYDKLLYYKGPTNDTLFYLDSFFNLIPKYFFNLGKYKEPHNKRADQFRREVNDPYFSVMHVFQTHDYLFIEVQLGDHFPAKRLTPIEKKLPSGEVVNIWFNTNRVLGVYNKNSEKISFCNPTNTDNRLFTTGFFNDIDAGPRFFPKIQINDSTMAMWIDAKSLKEHIASRDFKSSTSKYENKKKELEEFSKKISEFDNPILMEVTFKK